MNNEAFLSIFQNQVSILSNERRIAFAILISKKLFFDYQKFYQYYNWGNPDILMDAMRLCEKSGLTNIDETTFHEMKSQVDSIIPDTDDFGDELGSYALNAFTAVYDTLQYLLTRDYNYIVNIGSYYIDTIDFKILETDKLIGGKTDNHPLMLQARNFLIQHTK